MLRDIIGLAAKTDLSRLDGSDVARFASIFRDSAAFDARSLGRRGRRLAQRGGSYVVANPRNAGLGLGGVLALGLAGYAAYRMINSPKAPLVDGDAQAERPSVADDVELETA